MRRFKFPALTKIRLAVVTIIVLIALLVPTELFFRSSYADAVFMPPSYDVDSEPFDIMFSALESYYQREGSIDCIFLGSSIVHVSFEPRIFEEAYRAQTGEDFKCFNLGIATLSAESAGILAPMLIERFKPELLIYGLSPRAFIVPQPDFNGAFVQSDWLKYVNGKAIRRGFLINTFSIYRYYLRYQDWMSPEIEDLSEVIDDYHNALKTQGFRGTLRALINVNVPPALTGARRDKQTLTWLADYQPFSRDLDGLRRVAELNTTTDTRIMFIEVPNHETYMDYFADLEEGYSNFRQPVQQIASQYEVPMWWLRDLTLVPSEFWNDRIHMNINGAYVYSDWLGIQIGYAVDQSLLSDEVAPEILTGPPNPELSPKDIFAFYGNKYGLSEADIELFQIYVPPTLLPRDAVIWNPDSHPDDLRLRQFNIGVYVSSDDKISTDQRHEAFNLIYWFDQIMAQQIDADEHLPEGWDKSLNVNLLHQAGIDYLMVSDGWLLQQDSQTREILNDSSIFEPVHTLEHYTFAPVYTIYRIK